MTGHMAVETERLGRLYSVRGADGSRTKLMALQGVTLSVRRGEIFGVLGVNGAGKTTLLRILAGQLRPSSGTARVAGFDVCRYATHARRHSGLVSGDATSLLQMLAPDLSTGERRRVALVRGLIAGPTVMLLDQPTLGLDCVWTRAARAMIRQWVADEGARTVVLATNDLREAQELCDRVAILDAGRVAACDTPAALVEQWPTQPVETEERAAFGDLEAAFLRIVGRRAWAAVS